MNRFQFQVSVRQYLPGFQFVLFGLLKILFSLGGAFQRFFSHPFRFLLFMPFQGRPAVFVQTLKAPFRLMIKIFKNRSHITDQSPGGFQVQFVPQLLINPSGRTINESLFPVLDQILRRLIRSNSVLIPGQLVLQPFFMMPLRIIHVLLRLLKFIVQSFQGLLFS